MKKYETLKNEIAKAIDKETKTVTNSEFLKRLKDIAHNEAVTNLKSIDEKNAMYLLQYEQFEKAFTNKQYIMTLDNNYESTKLNSIELNMSTLLDTANKRVLHFYSHNTYIDIVISSNKATREKHEYLFLLKDDSFKVNFKRNAKKEISATTLSHIAFDNIVNVSKFALLILESSIDDLKAMHEAKQNEAEQ